MTVASKFEVFTTSTRNTGENTFQGGYDSMKKVAVDIFRYQLSDLYDPGCHDT
jgi:hypothetical protein